MPPEIRQDLLVKESNYDLPNTPEGIKFSLWWDRALGHEKRAVLRLAHEDDISVMEALSKIEKSIPELW
jgi:hypothetical protein